MIFLPCFFIELFALFEYLLPLDLFKKKNLKIMNNQKKKRRKQGMSKIKLKFIFNN
jgi:hypothetical protein